MIDLMIDLETMGRAPRGAIVALGAVYFDLDSGEIGATFHKPVSLEDAVREGMEMHPATVLWWLGQSQEAISAWRHLQCNMLGSVMTSFYDWMQENEPHPNLWAKGPSFDLTILSAAWTCTIGPEPPWHYRQEKCVRTIINLAERLGFRPESVPREGLEHHAGWDAWYQVRLVCEAWNWLRGRR